MPVYQYQCLRCRKNRDIFKPISELDRVELCFNCRSLMARIISPVGINGTRDSFGIGRNFIDDNTGREITTWPEWEKAGYRDPLSVTKDPEIRARCKRKIDKIKNVDSGKRITVS